MINPIILCKLDQIKEFLNQHRAALCTFGPVIMGKAPVRNGFRHHDSKSCIHRAIFL